MRERLRPAVAPSRPRPWRRPTHASCFDRARRCDAPSRARSGELRSASTSSSRSIAVRAQLIELVLKDRVELETEQYLRAEDQKPIFIQRGFELIIDRHLMIRKGDGGPARPRFETRTAA